MKKFFIKRSVCLICFISLLFTVITAGFLSACSHEENNYHATVTCKRYSELSGVLKDDFLQNNRLLYAYYNTAENGEEENYEEYTDINSPPLRSLLIKTQAEYDEIFMSQLVDVNFENQMLAICSWSRPISDTDYERTRVTRTKIVKLDNDPPSSSVLIVFKRDFSNNSNESDIDVQEYAFVVVDKLDVDGVHFSVGP